MPYSDHIHRWDQAREAADTRPTAPVTRAPAGMLGAWSLQQQLEFARAGNTVTSVDYRGRTVFVADVTKAERRCPDCGREPCRDCRLDRELARIHRGQP